MIYFKILILLFFLSFNTSLHQNTYSDFIPTYGSIPKNVKLSLKNSEEKNISLELTIKNKIETNIYLVSEVGELVETIVNKNLSPEKYNFNWNYNSFKKGNYFLYIELGNELFIYEIKVEQSWFSNLFKKKKVQKNVKTIEVYKGDIFTNEDLKTNNFFIVHNREGTSLGFDLKSKSKVDVNLLTIRGDLISKIVNTHLPKGNSLIMLSEYVKHNSNYLLSISVNGNQNHIISKIKR